MNLKCKSKIDTFACDVHFSLGIAFNLLVKALDF